VSEHCFSVTLSKGGSVTMVIDVPKDFEAGKTPVLVLAHGAGLDCRSEFMEDYATALWERGLCVVRFNFPFKEKTGKRPPDRMPVLVDAFVDVVANSGKRTGSPPGPLFVGGKSMGARVALNAVGLGRVRPSGLIYLGYPLHPPGKQEKLRTEAFKAVRKPHLFVQGTRDPFCDLELLTKVRQEFRVPGGVHLVEGGDHSFKQLTKRRHLMEAERDRAADVVMKFIRRYRVRNETSG
jgi:uncharacterized protein